MATTEAPPPSRREEILTAALACFAARGVVATSLEDIRRASGASVGSLYHAFPGGKEAIASALYVEGLAGYQERFVAELRRHPDAATAVKAIVELHLRWCARNPDLARFLLTARDAADEDALREHGRPFFADVMAWWRTHVRYGALRDLPLDVIQALWLGPAQELTRHWLAGRARRPSPADRRTLADAAWASLRSPP